MSCAARACGSSTRRASLSRRLQQRRLVGHCHPHVVAAIARQAATLNTHTRYVHEVILAYAEKLLGDFPARLRR